ncbi:retroviral aspartyl protease, partial [Opisthorchis viverrini]
MALKESNKCIHFLREATDDETWPPRESLPLGTSDRTNAVVTNQVTRSEIPEYVLHAAALTNRFQPPYQVELQVNGALMVFELDTGSAVTLCSEKSWQDNLGPTVKGKLQQVPVRLRTYTGEEVKLLGTKNVNVSYKGVTVNETIYIAEGSGPNLLGRDRLQQLPILTLNQVSTLPEVQSLIRNYEEVFSEPNTGKFSGGKVNIYVPPGTQPRFLKARSLPYLMRPKVEEELDRLQREGIIQSTEFSEWATPIVAILKPDSAVRICGDYKTTVNASTPPEHYPLPKIEDVYAQIGKNKYFSKLDLAHAYEQLELTEEAKPECGLRMKKEKCDFLVDHVDYLGFPISAEGSAPLAEK